MECCTCSKFAFVLFSNPPPFLLLHLHAISVLLRHARVALLSNTPRCLGVRRRRHHPHRLHDYCWLLSVSSHTRHGGKPDLLVIKRFASVAAPDYHNFLTLNLRCVLEFISFTVGYSPALMDLVSPHEPVWTDHLPALSCCLPCRAVPCCACLDLPGAPRSRPTRGTTPRWFLSATSVTWRMRGSSAQTGANSWLIN